MKEGGGYPEWPIEGAVGCRQAGELLQTRQYEQVAAILHIAQTRSAQAGDTILTRVLDAARLLCGALLACHAEAERLRQACQETERRELELIQELYAILELIDTGQVPGSLPHELEPPHGIPGPKRESLESERQKPSQRPRLWRRIQAIFGRRPPAQSHEPEPTIPSFATIVQPSTVSADLVQDLPPTPSLATQRVPSANDPAEDAHPSLVVYCLGPFRVYQGDGLITDWNGQKGKSIFKYLLAHRETPVAKDILMDLFWPDADSESARRSLHQAIYSLRQALRRGNPEFAHVYFENDCYLLNPEMSMWVDSIEFEEHLQAGRRLEAAGQITEAIAEYGIAESLYQGDYLEEDLYEDWPAVAREQFQRMYCDLADRLSEHYVRSGEHNAAIALCQKILERDNCYEPAYRCLMRCYLAQGQRHLAVRQYQTCVELLQDELEIGPSEETQALYQEITDSR